MDQREVSIWKRRCLVKTNEGNVIMKRQNKWIRCETWSVFLGLFIAANVACFGQNDIDRKPAALSQSPDGADEWRTTALAHSDIDSSKLAVLMKKILRNEYQNIHSLLIVQDGRLVFEHYFPGYAFKYDAENFRGPYIQHTRDTMHNLASVTKSITSILVGIAIDQGLINGTEDRLFSFFPQYASLNDTLKNQITLWHLLTMTSGFEWNEQSVFYGQVENDIIQLFLVPDPVKYILSKPIIHPPGTAYYYNGGNTNLLGEVIKKSSGLDLDAFAKQYLFDPLGIDHCQWVHINKDVVYASGDLQLRPRDMAQIGCLMLNNGVRHSQEIVTRHWVEESTKPIVHFNAREGYGYQWWIKEFKCGKSSIPSFSALGWGGQSILVLPSLDAVVVVTGGNYAEKSPYDEIIYRYILPALADDFKDDLQEIQDEAPIGENFLIIKPADTVNPLVARCSGHWYGRGDRVIADQLVVERIDADSAAILYSWGDHPDGYFQKGWVRKQAQVDSLGKLTFDLNGATLTFTIDQDEDVLIGYYEKGEATSKLIMNRLHD